MPKTLTAVDAFLTSLPSFPISGNAEPLSIDNLEPTFQRLLNNTLHLHNRTSSLESGVRRIRQVAGIANLSSLSIVDGEEIFVSRIGIYEYVAGSSTTADGLWIVNGPGGVGRYFHELADTKGANNGLATLTSAGRVAQNPVDGSIVTAHLADASVTSAKIADGAVGSPKLAAGSVIAHLGYTPVNRIGDTMTGTLFGTQFVTRLGTGNVDVVLQTAGGSTRWGIYKEVTEAAGDIGNDLWVNRYSNTQVLLGTPVKIRRSDGLVTLENALTVGGLSTFNGGFSGTSGILSGALNLDSAPGAIKVALRTAAGNQRWVMALENSEAGGNIGNDWALLRYDNTNAFLSRPIRIPRNTGIPVFDAGFSSPGVPTFDAGGIAAQFRASAANNFVGVGLYGDNSNLTTRHAYIGQPSPGVRDLVILNDVLNANISLSTTGTGVVQVNGNTIWHAGNFTPSNYATLAGTPNFTGTPTIQGQTIWRSGNFDPSSYLTTATAASTYVALTGAQTVAGVKNFSSIPTISSQPVPRRTGSVSTTTSAFSIPANGQVSTTIALGVSAGTGSMLCINRLSAQSLNSADQLALRAWAWTGTDLTVIVSNLRSVATGTDVQVTLECEILKYN
jgi:hypothetical protein